MSSRTNNSLTLSLTTVKSMVTATRIFYKSDVA